jgi:hypothetical protein
MTEPRNDDRTQARGEAATLLGVDIDHLSAADGLRVDMVSALRLVIDSEQASILSGGSADLGKLNVAVQSLIALLPNRELPESAASRADPRAHMWAVYSEMRRRGADVGQGYDGLKLENERLKAKIAELEASVCPRRASRVRQLPQMWRLAATSCRCRGHRIRRLRRPSRHRSRKLQRRHMITTQTNLGAVTCFPTAQLSRRPSAVGANTGDPYDGTA